MPDGLHVSDVIALASVLVAVVALAMSVYTTYITRHIATTGFQSAERVKSDTAVLLAALRGIMIKSALYTQQNPVIRNDRSRDDFIDISPEKAILQGFLNSSTAVAYYDLVAMKSRSAVEAGKQGEPWRVFFLYLATLLYTANTYAAGKWAARVEKMMDSLSEDDIKTMSNRLENLTGSIKRIAAHRKDDVLLHVLVDSKDEHQDFEAFIQFLHAKGIHDPDVDLFRSIISGDAKVREDALKKGARLSVTDTEIITRYKEEWKQFESA